MPEFEITAGTPDDLGSLYRHLRDEPLTGVRPSLVQGEPVPGEMGATEVLTVLLTSGSGLALANAVMAWVRTRQRSVSLTWRRTPDGEEVSFDASGPDVDEQLRRVLGLGHRMDGTGRNEVTGPVDGNGPVDGTRPSS